MAASLKLPFHKIGYLFSLWGVAMQAAANNTAMLLAGRTVGGLAIVLLLD